MNRVFDLPPGRFNAAVTVPGDKSLAHRALILGTVSASTSRVANLPDGADVAATVSAVTALGAVREGNRIESPGRIEWSQPADDVHCGNSGTTMRHLAGALAPSSISARLVGDVSLSRRPMGRLVGPLSALGASIEVSDAGTAPITVTGRDLRGSDLEIPVASAQVRTAVALAALGAAGSTRIDSPPGFRDHTERWLTHLGLGAYETATRFRIDPAPVPPLDLTIPGDPSSAAFLWAAAALRSGATITTPSVSINPGRLGFLEVLQMMGARVEIEPLEPSMGDPVGSVTVTGVGLRGVTIDSELVVRTIDELPLVAVLASVAEGATTVSDAAEARMKESDRIEAGLELARLCGAEGVADADGFTIAPGTPSPGPGWIDVMGDHRIAMAAAVAAMARRASVTVIGFEAADVSWPGFAEVLEGVWS